MQAVLTNVNGSANVIDRAAHAGVNSVVCLSTDKAVYPINAMGMTKALMEKVAQAWSRSREGATTTVSCVRYGNVMYSRGSVIPLFVSCIRDGRPLPITEPSMTRFMMPLSAAVELVDFALLHAGPGDLFIRKAPACTIEDLATALLELFGSSAPVSTVGFRHGEKLFETLASKEELRRAEHLDNYLRVRMDDRDLNYDKYFVHGDPLEVSTDDYDSHNTRRLSVEEVVTLLASLPEIRSELAAHRGHGQAEMILAAVAPK
jgi:UDP-glucose 4-epimerase